MLDTIYMQVLDMSKTASIVILVVLFARLLLKKAPKIFSYALWAVVLFRLLCPFSFETPVSVVPEIPSVSQGYTLTDEPISVFGASEAAYQAVGDALNGGLGIQHIRTTEKDETGMTRYVTTDWWSVWILFGQYVWAAGVAVMLLYSVKSYLKIRKDLMVVVPLRDNIFIADDIKSPFVVGLLRPKIYLPCDLGKKEQEYIILHEQHHIKRLDHIVKALAFLALTVHWFNPLVWLVFVLAGKDMEMSCDEAVIRKIGSDVRADYSASLLTLATGRRIIAGTPLAFGEGDTKGRINNLAKWKKPAVLIVVLAVIVCTVVAVCFLTDPETSVDERLAVFIDCEIASHNQTEYSKDNFCCLDWEVIGKETSGNLTTVYMWALYREYSNDNGLTVETASHLLTVLTVKKDNVNYSLVEYWIPKDGGYYTDSIKEKVPMYLWGKAMDSQRYIDRQSAKLEKLAKEHFGITTSNIAGAIIPGTTYVPYQCLYMNPLSSYAAIGGDSGCKYVVGEDYFTTIYRSNRISFNATSPDADIAQHRIEVPKWKWQKFPYTDEEWASLYWPDGIWSIENISEQYSEMLYQPLTSDKFLLKMDDSLWLVDISNDPKVGTYIWSIFSLVPESAMGLAQWEYYAQMLSSRISVFPFDFDLEHTEIIADCSDGLLGTYGFDLDNSMTVKAGETLYWSPVVEDGTVVSSAIIHFSVRHGETPTYNGTIYIEGSSGFDGRTSYTATIVGTGLHLEQGGGQQGGGVISIQTP